LVDYSLVVVAMRRLESVRQWHSQPLLLKRREARARPIPDAVPDRNCGLVRRHYVNFWRVAIDVHLGVTVVRLDQPLNLSNVRRRFRIKRCIGRERTMHVAVGGELPPWPDRQ
jgi:hypothetical protein